MSMWSQHKGETEMLHRAMQEVRFSEFALGIGPFAIVYHVQASFTEVPNDLDDTCGVASWHMTQLT